jgi:hypothetical protein
MRSDRHQRVDVQRLVVQAREGIGRHQEFTGGDVAQQLKLPVVAIGTLGYRSCTRTVSHHLRHIGKEPMGNFMRQ